MPNPFRGNYLDDLVRRLSMYADDGLTGRVVDVTPEGVARITSRRALEASPYLRPSVELQAPIYVSPDGVAARTLQATDRPATDRIDDYLRQFFDGDNMPLDITQ